MRPCAAAARRPADSRMSRVDAEVVRTAGDACARAFVAPSGRLAFDRASKRIRIGFSPKPPSPSGPLLRRGPPPPTIAPPGGGSTGEEMWTPWCIFRTRSRPSLVPFDSENPNTVSRMTGSLTRVDPVQSRTNHAGSLSGNVLVPLFVNGYLDRVPLGHTGHLIGGVFGACNVSGPLR